MKIFMVHGQSHKGSSYHISGLFVQKLAKEEITEFFLLLLVRQTAV